MTTAEVAIRAEGLGKKYLIGHQAERERYTALRDVIGRAAGNIVRTTSNMLRGRPMVSGDTIEEFWALSEVSFDVKRGEVLGILGTNGAGKSTLLKILSRITEPSAGRVAIHGRVASLLEVGTGFHPELTGRENIYLNGAILGMTRAEIRRKFDEMVAFAEVERFLDTPVKRYSSGMYVRLAFAVAAHLEPEILVIDEVLAVGDVEFQNKCLGKMQDVASKEGRTVLFVSHNMSAIRRLTQRCILLDKGRIVTDAPVQDTIERYLTQAGVGVANGVFVRDRPPPTDCPFYVTRVITRREAADDPAAQFDCDHPISISVEYIATRAVPSLHGVMQLQRLDGTIVYEADSDDAGRGNPFDRLSPGSGVIDITVPGQVLGPATYQIYMTFYADFDDYGRHIDEPGIVGKFRLDDTSTRRGNRRNGYLCLKLPWRLAGARQCFDSPFFDR